jgi:hypothetical protein
LKILSASLTRKIINFVWMGLNSCLLSEAVRL